MKSFDRQRNDSYQHSQVKDDHSQRERTQKMRFEMEDKTKLFQDDNRVDYEKEFINDQAS